MILPHRAIRTGFVASVLGVLAACTNGEAEVLPFQALTSREAPSHKAHVTALAQSGQPQLQVSIPKSSRGGLMVRETQRNGLTTWLSADGASLQTRNGLLQATRGLGAGLMAVDDAQSARLIHARETGQALRFHSFLSGNNTIQTRSYHCEITERGVRELTIGDETVTTRLMAETCANGEQRFLNLYWLDDATHQLVQSRQWSGPYLGNITTRLRRAT
ncbi:YjbF family lipoprotein [Phaeobacter italicus]|uniref:YjbF family lipoprotein n=1 Tax=Phaeobacter italicus TaxID=481446 RepID=UPI001FFE120F|nr:YjbF family lipoprotein [Phaeobacter italicus]